MSETFKEIKTQEELDAIIGKRLERERKTIEKQYEGYLSPEDVQKQYEGFLSAEDEIQKDAESFVTLMGTGSPMGSTEPVGDNKKNAAYKSLLDGIKGE